MRHATNLSICLVIAVGLLSLGCSEDTTGPEQVTKTTWQASAGGTLNDLGLGATTDASGNVIIVGSFEGRPNFGSTTLTSRGSSDIFVAKYSPAGGLIWVKSAGGTGEDAGWNAATDGSGNIFVTGFFVGLATFDALQIQSANLEDAFVAKYDPDGNVVWVHGAGGLGTDRARGIAIDGMGNVNVAGYFATTITFGTTTLMRVGNGTDIFLAKYDNAGNALAAQRAGGNLDDKAWGVTTDLFGNTIMTGFFQGTADFDSQTVTGSGNEDIFIAKYAPEDTLLWIETATGAGVNQGWDIATDASGSVLVSGSITGTVTFGGSGVAGPGGLLDGFIAKYTSTGGFAWVHTFGGTANDEALGIGIDGTGSAVIAGFFNTSAAFGTTTLTSAGGDDAFFAKYDALGNLTWAQSAGGTGQDSAFDGTVDGSGNPIGTGQFENTATFGGGNLTSAGQLDIFVTKGNSGGL